MGQAGPYCRGEPRIDIFGASVCTGERAAGGSGGGELALSALNARSATILLPSCHYVERACILRNTGEVSHVPSLWRCREEAARPAIGWRDSEVTRRRIPASTLIGFMDKKLSLKLNGGRHVQGILRGFDPFMNLVIDECVEMAQGGQQNTIGMVVIRGNSIIMLEALERV
ncbi:Small nuclear ribonucleoprotein G [Chelonia mydas]|uniref:Small nuclear ribonucleoprotein G n=2 Tax=Durocryptodira TaxID=1579337 RepID=M7B4S3_CHEMY|nr:Small nuclear ribonucleoprotein G [Chelonia mydas]